MYKAESDRLRIIGNSRGGKSSQKSDATSNEAQTHIRTDEQIAKLAGMSRDTIRKVKVIENEERPAQAAKA